MEPSVMGWELRCIAQQPSETKSIHCGATVSKVAPAGLPRSEIQALGRVEPFLSSRYPGQAIGGDPILPLTPLTKSYQSLQLLCFPKSAQVPGCCVHQPGAWVRCRGGGLSMKEGQCLPRQGRSHAHDLSPRTKSCVGFLDGWLFLQGTTVGEACSPWLC